MSTTVGDSAATRVTVTVAVAGGRLEVAVADDGRGGAHLGRGHGLSGLADRLAAADGTLGLSSPDGGPTVVTANLPTDAS